MGDINEWLRRLGMEQYIDSFAEHDISWELLPDLNDEVLRELGVASIGHRLRILKAIAGLRDDSEVTAEVAHQDGASIPQSPESDAAERRHLTVMFCDLVGSTALGERLDLEDYRQVLAAFRTTAEHEISVHGGFVARYMGDGLLVYFGYPRAREDDASRAVRAGLAVVAAVRTLRPYPDLPLSVRVGIATGVVVAGEIVGNGAAEEAMVMGHTPNLAARLQSMAQPSEVVIAEETRQLVTRQFAIESLGAHKLKGIEQSVSAFRVSAEKLDSARLVSPEQTRTPFVARKPELALLMQRWSESVDGAGQVVLICGEPGIGKSRIVQEFRTRLDDEPPSVLYFGVPHHQNTAFFPAIKQIEGVLRFSTESSVREKLGRLTTFLNDLSLTNDEVRLLLADLLSVSASGTSHISNLAPEQRKHRIFEALASVIEAISREHPVLFVVEDAHWLDPSTLEFLDLVVARAVSLPLMMVVTFRPDFRPSWRASGHLSTVTLTRLGRREIPKLIASVAGDTAVSEATVEEIVARTDGIPLFVEEVTKNVIEHGHGIAGDHGGIEADVQIPISLQDSLMARLDRLGNAKALAQSAAVIGRTFDRELLKQVSSLDEAVLEKRLEQLVASELVYRLGNIERTYEFKHALIRDAAYDSILKENRRRHHARIVEVLELRLERDAASSANLVETLAHHSLKAKLWLKAFKYARESGTRALERSAYREAITYLEQALAALRAAKVRSREFIEGEIDIRIMLRTAHGPIGNIKAMLDNLQVAESLAQEIDDSSRIATASIHLTYVLTHLGSLDRAVQLERRARNIATASKDRLMAAGASVAVSHAYLYAGQCHQVVNVLRPQRQYLLGEARDRRICSPLTSSVNCLSNLAMAHASLGEFDKAITNGEEAYELAKAARRPLDLGYAAWALGSGLVIRGDTDTAIETLNQGLSVCKENDLHFFLCANACSLAHAYSLVGRYAEGESLIERSLSLLESMGLVYFHVTGLAVAGLVKLRSQQPAETIGYCEKAHELARRHDFRGLEVFLLRLRGAALMENQLGDAHTARKYLQNAMAIAKELELGPELAHCQLELGRIYAAMGRRDESRIEVKTALDVYMDLGMKYWSSEAQKVLTQWASPGEISH